MANKEIIFQLKVDQSQSRKALENVSRQLIDARNELRVLNQSFRAAQKVIGDYDSKVGQLNKALSEGTITQEEYNEALEDTNAELKTAESVTESYTDEQIKLNQEIKKLGREQREYTKTLQNLDNSAIGGTSADYLTNVAWHSILALFSIVKITMIK